MRITIGVCTFRRPHVAETIRAILELERPAGIDLDVIVADNDAVESARALVNQTIVNAPFPVAYIHAPAHNISVARNAVLDAARGEWIAFVDDDETMPPDWISRLAARARTADADVVFGPSIARYPADAPEWIVRGDFHSQHVADDLARTGQGHTSNVLFRWTNTPWSSTRFDPALGRSGGEDTAFFQTLRTFGARFALEAGAMVYEDVSPNRLSFAWLWRRRFRYGQTHATLLRRAGARAPIEIAKAGAKAAACMAMAGLSIAAPVARRRWLLRGALHCGVVARLAGGRDLELY